MTPADHGFAAAAQEDRGEPTGDERRAGFRRSPEEIADSRRDWARSEERGRDAAAAAAAGDLYRVFRRLTAAAEWLIGPEPLDTASAGDLVKALERIADDHKIRTAPDGNSARVVALDGSPAFAAEAALDLLKAERERRWAAASADPFTDANPAALAMLAR